MCVYLSVCAREYVSVRWKPELGPRESKIDSQQVSLAA